MPDSDTSVAAKSVTVTPLSTSASDGTSCPVLEHLQVETLAATVRGHRVFRGANCTHSAASEFLAQWIESPITVRVDPETVVRVEPSSIARVIGGQHTDRTITQQHLASHAPACRHLEFPCRSVQPDPDASRIVSVLVGARHEFSVHIDGPVIGHAACHFLRGSKRLIAIPINK